LSYAELKGLVVKQWEQMVALQRTVAALREEIARQTVPPLQATYRDLKAYRCAPTKQRKAALRARFDRIFRPKAGFVTLDRLLVRLACLTYFGG
jgi:hypothetical protein